MSKKHRLGRLQVSIPRHDDIKVAFCLIQQSLFQLDKVPADGIDLVTQVETNVESNLVVT